MKRKKKHEMIRASFFSRIFYMVYVYVGKDMGKMDNVDRDNKAYHKKVFQGK